MNPTPRPHDELAPAAAPASQSLMRGAATRREVFLFGVLILALVWITVGQRQRTIVLVPDSAVRVGVIT
jgi:hypothetical protein